MAKTINEGFNEFLIQLTPTAAETATAKIHRESIEACLKSNFGLNRFFRIGSFGNGTSISGYSDVDYLACIPTNQLTETSNPSLVKVKNALDRKFPNTGVKVDCPAVSVPFGTKKSESHEIVPADYIKENNGYKVYKIANCSNGWMEASPDAHNDYVRSIDQELGNKVKPLIRFIKAWKYYQNVPISSFYLELRVAKYASEKSSIIYSVDVDRFLRWLRDNELPKMIDPKGISGYIYPCKSENDYRDAILKLNTAADRAEKARNAESNGDIPSSFHWWGKLYNNQFPIYG